MNSRKTISSSTQRSRLCWGSCLLLVIPALLTGCAVQVRPLEVSRLQQRSDYGRGGLQERLAEMFRAPSSIRQTKEVAQSNRSRRGARQQPNRKQVNPAEATQAATPRVPRVPDQDHDIAQVSYQTPVERTYASPSHRNVPPPHPGYPPHGPHAGPADGFFPHPNSSQQPRDRRGPRPTPDPMLAAPATAYDQPVNVTGSANELPPPSDLATMESIDENHHALPPADDATLNSGRTRHQDHVGYPLTDSPSSTLGNEASLAHLTDGIRVSGSHLSTRPLTATERALELKSENDELYRELSALKARVGNLTRDIKRRDSALKESNRLTQEAHRANAILRDSIAVYKVRLSDAEKENRSIRQNADRTLEEIENTLDAVLVNTLSQKRRP